MIKRKIKQTHEEAPSNFVEITCLNPVNYTQFRYWPKNTHVINVNDITNVIETSTSIRTRNGISETINFYQIWVKHGPGYTIYNISDASYKSLYSYLKVEKIKAK